MNIEEDSIEQSIVKSRGLPRHMHFSDNNRKIPGCGHINFQLLIKTLSRMGYDKYISFEPNLPSKAYETATKSGLEFIKTIEKNISDDKITR